MANAFRAMVDIVEQVDGVSLIFPVHKNPNVRREAAAILGGVTGVHLVDPLGYAAEQDRLRKAYAEAYRDFFRDYLPDNGVPARFTVHLVDVPDKAASYEFYGTALYQQALQSKKG